MEHPGSSGGRVQHGKRHHRHARNPMAVGDRPPVSSAEVDKEHGGRERAEGHRLRHERLHEDRGVRRAVREAGAVAKRDGNFGPGAELDPEQGGREAGRDEFDQAGRQVYILRYEF